MIKTNKLMKKISLFILNLLFISINLLSVYLYLVYFLTDNTDPVYAAINFEPILGAIGLIPIYLILALIFYVFKNFLCISKFNRRLPVLTFLIYITIIVADGLVVKFIKLSKIIPHDVWMSSPTNTCIIINFIFSVILLILSIVCTVKSLFKN